MHHDSTPVLERLPSGDYAWLRPETTPRVRVVPDPRPDRRYTITDRGRRALLIDKLLSHGPTVAEVS